jgi:O-antigen ligase
MKFELSLLPAWMTVREWWMVFCVGVLASVSVLLFPSKIVGILLALGILFVIAVRWFHVGFDAIALTYPFIHGTISITTERYLPVVDAIGILMLGAWILRKIRDHTWRKIRIPAGWAIALFVGSGILSLLNAPDLASSIQFLLRPLVFFLVVFVLLPISEVTSVQHLTRLLREMAVVGVGFILVGAISLVITVQPESIPRVVPLPIFGQYLLGGNHNEFAEVLVGLLPIFWFFGLTSKAKHHRQAWVAILVGGIGITLLTLSRAAWIAIAVQAFIIGVTDHRQRIRSYIQRVFPVVVLVLAPIVWLMINLLTSRVGYLANANRLFLVEIAWDAFGHHPWIGAGAGTFLSLVEAERYYIFDFGSSLDAHGVMWKLLSEMGLLGLISFLVMSGSFFAIAWKQLRRLKRTGARLMLLALFTSALGIWIFEWLGTSYYLGKLWWPVGLMLTAVYLTHNHEKARRPHPVRV